MAALMQEHVEEMAQQVRSALPRMATLTLPEAVGQVVHLMITAHALDPALHRVLVEQVPRIGELERIETLNLEMMALTRAFLEARRHELIVSDLELASSIVVVEALTHTAAHASSPVGRAFRARGDVGGDASFVRHRAGSPERGVCACGARDTVVSAPSRNMQQVAR